MSKTKDKLKEIKLEDQVHEIEQKITNNNYEIDSSIEQGNALLTFRFKSLSQADFGKIQKRLNKPEGTSLLLSKTLINRETNKFFTQEEIDTLFKPGTANDISKVILEESGFDLNKLQAEVLRKNSQSS